MEIGEILAYLTLALLVASYFMPTMIWLRAIATAAAIVIVAYGAVTGHWIAAVIGAAIAAINLWRLYEMITGHPVEYAPFEMDIGAKPPVETVALWSPRDGIVHPRAARGLQTPAMSLMPRTCAPAFSSCLAMST